MQATNDFNRHLQDIFWDEYPEQLAKENPSHYNELLNQFLNHYTMNTDATTTAVKPIHEKRDKLREMSNAVKPLIAQGVFEKINEAIIETFYRKGNHQEFHTFWQWVEKGYRVKKGETAFFVWAKPLSAQAQLRGETLGEDERDFYPLCFLFSNAQVEQIKK